MNKRTFNVTGVCVPHKHYMADTSEKINQIIKLVEQGNYFTINRPRQYGKTTTMFLLEKINSKIVKVVEQQMGGPGRQVFGGAGWSFRFSPPRSIFTIQFHGRSGYHMSPTTTSFPWQRSAVVSPAPSGAQTIT